MDLSDGKAYWNQSGINPLVKVGYLCINLLFLFHSLAKTEVPSFIWTENNWSDTTVLPLLLVTKLISSEIIIDSACPSRKKKMTLPRILNRCQTWTWKCLQLTLTWVRTVWKLPSVPLAQHAEQSISSCVEPTPMSFVAWGPSSILSFTYPLHRPPGHHVGRRGFTEKCPGTGFCLLNNAAIAMLYARYVVIFPPPFQLILVCAGVSNVLLLSILTFTLEMEHQRSWKEILVHSLVVSIWFMERGMKGLKRSNSNVVLVSLRKIIWVNDSSMVSFRMPWGALKCPKIIFPLGFIQSPLGT